VDDQDRSALSDNQQAAVRVESQISGENLFSFGVKGQGGNTQPPHSGGGGNAISPREGQHSSLFEYLKPGSLRN